MDATTAPDNAQTMNEREHFVAYCLASECASESLLISSRMLSIAEEAANDHRIEHKTTYAGFDVSNIVVRPENEEEKAERTDPLNQYETTKDLLRAVHELLDRDPGAPAHVIKASIQMEIEGARR